MRRTAVLLLASLTLAACGEAADLAGAPSPPASSAEPGLSPSSSPSTSATQAGRSCTHPTEGYTVTFPVGWHVADDEGVEPCSFFHPEPLELEPGTEADGVAVRVDVLTEPFREARRMVEDDGAESSTEESVSGRDAVRVQGHTTGEGMLPAGLATTTWLVDMDDRTLLLTTDEGGRDDYGQAVEVLDAMARSVEVT